jgi:hypothetical protein
MMREVNHRIRLMALPLGVLVCTATASTQAAGMPAADALSPADVAGLAVELETDVDARGEDFDASSWSAAVERVETDVDGQDAISRVLNDALNGVVNTAVNEVVDAAMGQVMRLAATEPTATADDSDDEVYEALIEAESLRRRIMEAVESGRREAERVRLEQEAQMREAAEIARTQGEALSEQVWRGDEYIAARRALDEERWAEARQLFAQIAEDEAHGSGAALFWMAYADAQAGRVGAAVSSIIDLIERYPLDAYIDDAMSLMIEIDPELAVRVAERVAERLATNLDERAPAPPAPAQPPQPPQPQAGQSPPPPAGAPAVPGSKAGGGSAVDPDAELELLALEGLMATNPTRAVGYLKDFLASDRSPGVRQRALFLLAHSGYPEAPAILMDVVLNGEDPGLRGEALRLIGLTGDEDVSGEVLVELYETLESPALRRRAIEGLRLSGNSDRLASLAAREPSPALREQIVRQLGVMGDADALRRLYAEEDDAGVRGAMLEGLALAGDTSMLLAAAQGDDPMLARRAVQVMALVDDGELPVEALLNLHARSDDAAMRQAIARVFAAQGNSSALLTLYRQSDDRQEKAQLVSMLRGTGGALAEEVFVDILEGSSP